MAEVLAVAEVVSLITTLVDLIARINAMANNVRAARKSALNLANRVRKLQNDLVKILTLPNNQKQCFVERLNQFQNIFMEVESFLHTMQRTSVQAATKRILWNGLYAQRYTDLYEEINEAIIDFTLSLAIHTRNEHWDSEDPMPVFRPILSEMAPINPAVALDDIANEPGSDVEEESLDFIPSRQNSLRVPWNFEPRPTETNSSTVFESMKNEYRDYYIHIHMLRKVPQNTRVTALHVIVSKFAHCQIHSTAEADHAADELPVIAWFAFCFWCLLFLIAAIVVDAGWLVATTITSGRPCTTDFTVGVYQFFTIVWNGNAIARHYSVEFQLENGMVGTIEDCEDDIYLYEGSSTRAQKHVVLVADLENLAIQTSLSDLVRLRNDHRCVPYCLWKNNCKHFAFHALKALMGDYRRTTTGRQDTFDGFCNSCQRIYSLTKNRLNIHDSIIRSDDGVLMWKSDY